MSKQRVVQLPKSRGAVVPGHREAKSATRAEILRKMLRAELDQFRGEIMVALAFYGEQLEEVRRQADLLSLIVQDTTEGLTPEVLAAYIARVNGIRDGIKAGQSIAAWAKILAAGAPEAAKRALAYFEEHRVDDEAELAELAERAGADIIAAQRQAQADDEADAAERAAALGLSAEDAAPLPAGHVRTAGGLVVPG